MDVYQWSAIGLAVAISVLLVTAARWALKNKLAKVWKLADFIVVRTRVTAYIAAAVVGANLGLPQEIGRAHV